MSEKFQFRKFGALSFDRIFILLIIFFLSTRWYTAMYLLNLSGIGERLDWLWMVSYFGETPPKIAITFLYLLDVAFCIWFFFRRSAVALLLSWVTTCSFFAAIFSFGKIDHDLHIWILSFWVFLFYETKNAGTERRESDDRVGRYLVAQVATIYFLSGLWKVIGMGGEIFFGDAQLSKIFHNLLLYNLIEKGFEAPSWAWAIARSYYGVGLYLSLIIFQVSSFALYFKPYWFRLYFVGFIVFHLSTTSILRIGFFPTVAFLVMCLVFIRVNPLCLQQEDPVDRRSQIETKL